MPASSPKFTLRFQSARTHEMLGVVAEELGMSKNQLAEELLARELQAVALSMEQDLLGTMELLRRYNRREHLTDYIEAFAEGEAFGDDPLQSRARRPTELSDTFGIAEVFAR